ncbi:PEP-CTERM sorting domain-containing protein [Aquincola sp. MAHUQ-54]|uniref:PEP-CTERM sorting domain-containing protein n=1 Tax=Aquincola agrisoli TaxID=3119538 RepID=A0AAW9PZJ3_9BURK
MFTKTWIAAAATAATFALPAHADIVTFTGNTTAGMTYTRALDDFSAPSAVGADVRYELYAVTVSAAGDYTFLTTGDFDTFTFLYTSFDPASPLSGGMIANDDLLGTGTSGFTVTLDANTQYSFVVTGYQGTDFGFHSTTIGGIGTISAVPEPSTYLMLAMGLGAVALRRRRLVKVDH